MTLGLYVKYFCSVSNVLKSFPCAKSVVALTWLGNALMNDSFSIAPLDFVFVLFSFRFFPHFTVFKTEHKILLLTPTVIKMGARGID